MVVATAEVDIPESWSGVVHDAPFARHAKPRSWLEWAQLLYSERHLQRSVESSLWPTRRRRLTHAHGGLGKGTLCPTNG